MMALPYSLRLFAILFLAGVLPAAAQLPGEQTDPLARIREAAKTNVQACSATEETLCEQVAPKIIANAQGDSPLTENLHRLALIISERKPETDAGAASWGVAAFRAAGVDVRTENDAVPGKNTTVPNAQEIVVAEIRGREKPDEWVVLGAHFHPHDADAVRAASNAALVVEAARDIQLTGIRPRRSIRFVLFTGAAQDMLGSWAYVHAHQGELDRVRAAISLEGGAGRVNGFKLFGRRDIESGVREAMKPIESWGAGHHTFDGTISNDNIDFLLEGIPAIVADQQGAQSSQVNVPVSEAFDKIDIQELKRNTAIAAVTAFGIAERAEPLGPRKSRAEIETLLKSTGLGEQMKTSGLWPLWESGRRGRLP
jgi:Zn-dependent M28 family amino/carboxypeptidase